nr:MAG TPA: Single strand binding protein [Caudoviricetes sp.]
MNIIILKGRLTRNPEIKQTANGVAVCTFPIAVDRKFKKDETDFINCTAWRQTAKFIQKYFTKGQEICISGNLQVRKWEDKDGNTRYATDVVVDNAEFCGSKKDGSMANGSLVADENKYKLINDDFLGNPLQDEVDLPF